MGGLWRGDERGGTRGGRNRTAITVQDYVACCSPQPLVRRRRVSVRRGGERGIRRKRGRRISIRGADRTLYAFCARLIRKGRRDRSIPGLPRSVLGLQDPPLPGGGKQLRSSSNVLLLPRRYRAAHGHITGEADDGITCHTILISFAKQSCELKIQTQKKNPHSFGVFFKRHPKHWALGVCVISEIMQCLLMSCRAFIKNVLITRRLAWKYVACT